MSLPDRAEQKIMQDEARDRVWHWLNMLNDETRQIVYLRYGLGMMPEEIAKYLTLRVDSVKSRLHRGMTNIREWSRGKELSDFE